MAEHLSDCPGVRAWGLADAHVGIALTPPIEHFPTEADEALWDEVRRLNPRVHDGPILRVVSFCPEPAEITCAIDSYKSLAIRQARREKAAREHIAPRPFDPSLIWLLGVKGWIVGRDRDGHEHLLIARRGLETRIYGGMWESAPAGGVQPVPGGPPVLTQTLAEESEEELGLSLNWSNAKLLGVAQDNQAMSYDVFYQLELPGVIDPRRAPVCPTGVHAWEYLDSAWLSKRDAASFDRQSPDAIVPSVRSMLRVAKWII